MKQLLRMLPSHFLERIRKKNTVAGLFLGIITITVISINYGRYSGSHTVNIAEPYLMCISKGLVFIMLGFIISVMDAPFVDNNSCMYIYRMGRKKWYHLGTVRMFLYSLIYNLVLVILTMLIFWDKGYPENKWSVTILHTVNNGDFEKLLKYNLQPVSGEFIEDFTPFAALLHSFLLAVLYMFLLGMVLYSINLLVKRVAFGTICVAVVNWFSFLLHRSFFLGTTVFVKYSMQICGFPAWGYGLTDEKSLTFNYAYLLLVTYLVFIIGETIMPAADFLINNEVDVNFSG